ncbi:hypothetical protein IT407_05045 [Candidatus Uhrbacteria bacterium]|nr:hypothetical protein [Candidatus Uhrbacteria bacterium]
MRNPFERGPLMSPADGERGGGRSKHHEMLEKEKNLFFLDLILRRARKMNEGNNGLICSLDLSNAGEEEVKACEELGILESGKPDGAIKLLKIFSGGAVIREFRAQQHAWKSVQKAREAGREDLASIPKVRIFTTLDVNADTRDMLMRRFGYKAPTQSVDAFVMDRVYGKDVATIMFQEVLLRHRDSNYRNRETIEAMDFQELAQHAYNVLGLASRFSGDVGGELNAETRRLQNMQAQKVYDFLGDSGLRIHPPLLQAMRNTIGVFHKEGLVWRDGHQRNFMIAGEYDADKIAKGAEPGEPYVIDFGGSEVLGHPPGSDEAREDFVAIDKLIDVFVKGETTKSKAVAGEQGKVDAWQRKSERMSKHPVLGPKLLKLESEWKSGSIDMKKVFQTFSRPGDASEDVLPAIIQLIARSGMASEAKEALKEYLVNEEKRMSPADQRNVRNFIKQME